MKRFRRVASVVTMTAVMAAAGLAAMPTAQAGLPEAEPPAAYAITSADLLVSCALATVDLTDGTTTVLPAGGSAGACVEDLAVAPDGSVWGIREVGEDAPSVVLVQFDPATGAVVSSETITGSFPEAGLEDGGLAFDAAGTLYVQIVTDEAGCDNQFVCLYTVDLTTTAATFVGAAGPDKFETEMFFLGADCAGSMVTSEGDDIDDRLVLNAVLDAVDPATGVVTDGPEFPDDFALAGLDYSRADSTLYALGTTLTPAGAGGDTETSAGEWGDGDDVSAAVTNASLYVVDPATAGLTLVAALSEPNLDISTLGIAGQCPVPPTPAPAPIVLEPTFTG